MLRRLRELADQPLARGRAPAQRMVGCCRDFTVLFVALARQHGFAARARVGFARYFRPGWSLDHVVAEVWDARPQRECRSGTADVSRFVVAPEVDIPATKGWPQVRHNLLHDLAALAKHEMLLWDDWGLAEMPESTAEQLALLDSLAAATSAGDPLLAQIAAFSRRDGLGVPPVVTSYSPASPAPRHVSV